MHHNTPHRLRILALLAGSAALLAPVPAAARASVPVARLVSAAIARGASAPPPDLTDVACPSARVCYAVGYHGIDSNGVIYVTRDGAHTWSKQWGNTKWGLRGITCLSTATCYSVGYAETILVTTNGGRSWQDPHRARSPQDLSHVACPTSRTCIATGDAADGIIYHRIVMTTDGGRTWSYPPTPIDHTLYPLNGITCPSARVCYAVGAGSTILVTQDGGRTWQQQRNPAMTGDGVPLTGVACTGVRACVVVGGIGGSAVLTTDDGGRTWTSQAPPVRSPLTAVACPAPGVCYAVGADGTALLTRDAGRTWAAESLNTQTFLNAIACHGVGFCVVVGDSGYIATLTPAPANAPASPTAGTQSPPQLPALPTVQPTPTAASGAPACRAWNVSGQWTFTAGPVSIIGRGSGPATLTQRGDTLAGTVNFAGGWTISGTVRGDAVTLTWSATGQVPQSDSGTIAADGTTITTNLGTFRGKAACVS